MVCSDVSFTNTILNPSSSSVKLMAKVLSCIGLFLACISTHYDIILLYMTSQMLAVVAGVLN